MSATLVESYSGDFTPEDFSDDYQIQLQQLIDAKIEQGEDLDTEATFGAASSQDGEEGVLDLMEALKRSIAGNGKSAGKGSAGKPSGRASGTRTPKKSTASANKAGKSGTAKKKKASSSASKKKASSDAEKSA